jgi:MFS family permease
VSGQGRAGSVPGVPLGSSRFVFATVLASTMGAATFALTCYAVLAPDLILEFGVDRWQIGALVTAMSLGGAFISPRVGSIADAMGAKRSTTGTIVVATAALVGLALAPSYWLIVVAALVGGVAQAMANPATNKLIALHVEPGKRGVITGIKQSGVTAASFLGGVLLPPVAIMAGWRWAVALFALIATMGGLLSLTIAHRPAGASGDGDGQEVAARPVHLPHRRLRLHPRRGGERHLHVPPAVRGGSPGAGHRRRWSRRCGHRNRRCRRPDPVGQIRRGAFRHLALLGVHRGDRFCGSRGAGGRHGGAWLLWVGRC